LIRRNGHQHDKANRISRHPKPSPIIGKSSRLVVGQELNQKNIIPSFDMAYAQKMVGDDT
jgi:hypothetical protein